MLADQEVVQGSFITTLLREDELGAVIRAQIYLEHELMEFVRARLQDPDALTVPDLSYGRLVRLALALGLSPRLARPLTAFGRIRNSFAHRLDTALTETTVRQFCGTFGAEMINEADQAIERFRFMAVEGNIKDSLTPRGLFIMYAYSLWFRVTAETRPRSASI